MGFVSASQSSKVSTRWRNAFCECKAKTAGREPASSVSYQTHKAPSLYVQPPPACAQPGLADQHKAGAGRWALKLVAAVTVMATNA
jgi:hypothetical protein